MYGGWKVCPAHRRPSHNLWVAFGAFKWVGADISKWNRKPQFRGGSSQTRSLNISAFRHDWNKSTTDDSQPFSWSPVSAKQMLIPSNWPGSRIPRWPAPKLEAPISDLANMLETEFHQQIYRFSVKLFNEANVGTLVLPKDSRMAVVILFPSCMKAEIFGTSCSVAIDSGLMHWCRS